ncbi:hypothetical protein BKP56_00620 [Marinilactibacillus sp. 15R]|uniref:Transcobalamin-like C-terminal domain-containing protein n=1 Tax=Marinilactibacillus piezotolerans TaxID=258723 RepID=A0A1I3Z657_9LACT|nr:MULTISPECIES: DUF4430 domain-containing protein [Marinilactibacillus]API87927.1 hypothetical protein BKP56_00620 [Marinilactibacillus sp. 15R]SFK39019.1 protein of unknown function [Marinilactibacillus piezotolerans]
MKKKTTILLSTATALIALAFILWIIGRNNVPNSNSEKATEVTVQIYANEEELANDSLSVSADTTLMDAMEENYELTVSGDGFVEAIEGIEQSVDNNEFWVFEANDEMVTEPAEEFILEDGDTISWELMEF